VQETRHPWIPFWLWAGIAVALLLAFFSAQHTRKLRKELMAEEAWWKEEEKRGRALESQQKHYRRILAVLSSPGTRGLLLKSTANSRVPPARIWAYWNDQEGLVLTGHHVPPPAAGRTFQLWVLTKKGNAISAATFRPDAKGQVLVLSKPAASMAEAATLGITEEPSGAVGQPSAKPLWESPVR